MFYFIMDLMTLLVKIVCLYLAYVYIRCFFKRLICFYKIRRLCKKKGFQLHEMHPFWFFGSKHGEKCDCYIETPNEVFAVKMFGMSRRHTMLVLMENRRYSIRSFIVIARWVTILPLQFDTPSFKMPMYDFRYKYKDEWEIKTPRRILLVNPVCLDFICRGNRMDDFILNEGDIYNGMELNSLSNFLRILEATTI